MEAHTAGRKDVALTVDSRSFLPRLSGFRVRTTRGEGRQALFHDQFVVQLAIVFLAFLIAGKLGQATTSIRSGNLGPVWPASGIALAAVLAYGSRVWPALAASSFVVAFQSPVLALTAMGQAAGATLAAVVGASLLRRVHFEPELTRLRDVFALTVVGALASSTISASIGLASLYGTRLEAYSGLTSAWLIYWLGDATGVLLVTPLVFTLPALFRIRSRPRLIELAALLTLLTAACFLVFGDLPFLPVRLHVLAFVVLPFVMWAAIDFGIGGASLSVFIVATAATLLTALGYGPFSESTPFVNAALLDVLFTVLAVTGLALAAVISERERAEVQREQLIRTQSAMEARLRLAAIVESSSEAIVSATLDDAIVSWNAAAHRIFGFAEAEVIGLPTSILVPAELRQENRDMLERLKAGTPVAPYETIRITKAGRRLDVAVTMSPLLDAEGKLVGVAKILRDITDSKRAEEALSSVSRRLIDAQEEERSRIARELHDDIGQRLALLVLNLGLAKSGSDGVATLQRQASEIAADIQAVSHRLHSARLDLLGISATARHLCDEFAVQQRVTIDFDSRGLPERLPSDVALCLFRILQEALHNAAKHSGVRRFEVRLWSAQAHVHLFVGDGGKGFDVAAARAGRGLGLVSMRERIKLVDGELSIESRLQQGTTVHARVPCAAMEPPVA